MSSIDDDLPSFRIHLYFLFFVAMGLFLLISISCVADTNSMKFIAEYNLTDTADGIPSQGYWVRDVYYLPDNEQLALTGTSKNLWNIHDRTYIGLMGGDTHTYNIAYNSESNRLVFTYSYGESLFYVINLNTEPPSFDIINYSGVTNITFNGCVVFGDNSSVIYLAGGKNIYRWEYRIGEWSCHATINLADERDRIKTIFYDEDRANLIAVNSDGDCYIFGADLSRINRINFTGLLRPKREFSLPLKPICYLQNQSVVWTNHDVIIFNLTSGTYSIVDLPSVVNSPLIIPSHNGKWIAIVDYAAVHIYDLKTFERITYFLATGQISAICWNYDDTRIVTVDYNGVAQIWINIMDPGYNRRPSVDIDFPVEGSLVNNSIRVHGNSSDDDIVSTVLYRIDDATWTIADGTSDWSFWWDTRYISNGYHRISVRAFDGEQYSHLVVVNVNVQNNDTNLVPPVITIELPLEDQIVTGQVTFSGRVYSPNRRVSVQLSFHNETRMAHLSGTHWFISIDTRPLPDATMTFNAIANDGILNSTPAQVNITIQNTPGPINKPPWVNITSPRDGETIAGLLDIQGRAIDPEEHLRFLMIKMDDAPWISIAPLSEWQHRIDSWTLQNGQHTLLVICSDDIQNSEIKSVSFIISNDLDYPFGKPICNIVSPQNGSVVSGYINITGIANDDYSISSVWVTINRGPIKQVKGTYEWQYELETMLFDNGPITLSFVANDGINESTPVILTLFIENNMPPFCKIIWPENGSIVEGVITVIGVASDDKSIERVHYSVGKGQVKDATGTTEWSFQLNTMDYNNDPLDIEVWSFDSQEESTHVIWRFIVRNNQAPTCIIEHPDDGAILKSDIEIHGYASDPDGDILAVDVRIDNGSWMSCAGGTQWSINMSISDLAPGHHYIEARSSDGHLFSSIDNIEINITRNEPQDNSTSTDSNDIMIFIIIILIFVVVFLILYPRLKTIQRS